MNNEQFWKLTEEIHAEAAAFCRRLSGDRDLGDDLYQDSLLTALARIGQLRQPNAFKSWFYRIIINQFKNRRRSWWRVNRVDLALDELESSGNNDPRRSQEIRRWLQKALGRLSVENRAILIMHDVEGRTVAEIAQLVGRPEGTIKTRLFRSRAKLRGYVHRALPKPKTRTDQGEASYALPKSQTID